MVNVYVIDAADLDEANGTIVPKGITDDNNGDPVDEESYSFPRQRRDVKHEWGVKVVNDADQDIDATPVISTSDDEALDEYDVVDAMMETVPQGTVPDNVELFESDIIAAFIGIELQPAAAATGSVKIVFQSRRMG